MASSIVSVTTLAFFALMFILLKFTATFLACRIKSIPGPWYTAFTHLALKYHIIRGTRMYYVDALHHKYGPLVRIAPGEVDVSDPQAVHSIHRAGSGFVKAKWYEDFSARLNSEEGEQCYVGVFAVRDPRVHSAKRRLFARPFSYSSLLTDWDDVVRAKVRLAVDWIRAEGPGGTDVLKWWTLMATDVVAHLMFGESFHSLELGKQSPLIDALQKAALASILTIEFPSLRWIGPRLPFKFAQALFYADEVVDEFGGLAYRNLRSGDLKVKNMFGVALATADKADLLERTSPLPEQNNNNKKKEKKDFVEQTVRHESTNFLVAGSDTTAATLTYLVWAVLRQPALRRALEEEVAGLGAGLSQEELQHRAPLLNSVIDETLRLYAAAPSGLPRDVPAGGSTLCGHFVPEGVITSHQGYTLHRDPNIFPNPLQFDGWRFIKQPATPAQKAAFVPFGLGSRICLGIHLAMMELRFATALFFRECRGAELCSETTDGSMAMVDAFLISPKAHRCRIVIPGEKPQEHV